MRRASLTLALAAVLAGGVPAHAGDSPYVLYASGHYEEAIRAGEAAQDAPGLAIAARAALAEAMLRPSPCMSCLERAEDFASRAVAADPRYSDGEVWLAAALGYQARITGPVQAPLEGKPARARKALDMALKYDPANPYALAALGGWHIEIVRLAGGFLARRVFGAEEAEGLALFDRALRAAPANVAVHYQIALSLAGYDRERFRDRIQAQLGAAAADPPATAYERFMAGRAGELVALLKAGDDAAFAQMVHRYQGYP